ncbi:MAG: bifunctional hydroxymethylpyrimidine kinase/phosphomethylpyrimidine kinase [Oscillospiraceae bacterium]|jgi:pseudouridine kinase|nr:bifunctional hydroxymethylpyrimidine kinase/phosphomethylpyrimidine kinase [Oscillospiraceae bacterium]
MPQVVVIGAVNIDIGAISSAPLQDRDSNPGRVRVAQGGVGRNIAHNLCLLGVDTAMVTALGEDGFAEAIRAGARDLGLDLSRSAVIPGGHTSAYVYLAGPDGDMTVAVNDMDIYRHMTPDFLAERLDFINSAELAVMDANLPAESIAWLGEHVTVPLVADPVSAVKAEKLRPVLGRLTALKPNRLEAEALSGVPIRTAEDAALAAERLLAAGLRQVYISLSSRGIVAASRTGERAVFPCPRVKVINATGGGDAMTAALAASLLRGDCLADAARNAICAGAFASTAETTIHPAMSWKNIEIIRESEELWK